jgi:hypothetical protein
MEILKTYKNSNGHNFTILAKKGYYTLINDLDAKYEKYIVAWMLAKNNYTDDFSWGAGHYFQSLEAAQKFLGGSN